MCTRGNLLKFSMPEWDRKKMLGCGLLHVSIPRLIQWFFTNYSFQFCFFFYKLKFDTDGILLKAYFEMPNLEFTLYLSGGGNKCPFPSVKVRGLFCTHLLEKGEGAGIFFYCFGGGNKTCYD